MDFTYNQYIDDILTNKIKSCKHLKMAVKRHVNDIKRSKESFPYYFDENKAQKAIKFFCLLVHIKGKLAGQFLHPLPWQQFIIAVLYGWRRKDNNKRRFKRCYLQVARKNGKTFFSAGVGLYDLITEPGAEVYSAATKKEQAKICFNAAKASVNYSKPLKKYIKSHAHNITCGEGKMTALSADTQTQDGLNPSCGIIDEYHAHKTDELLSVIESGMGMREQPLIFIITTAGHNLSYPCYEEYQRCCKLLEGAHGYENEEYAVFIYELDKNDDYTNPANWIKANPCLDEEGAVSSEGIKSALLEAQQKPSKLSEFLTKRMDIWVNNAESWIDWNHWSRCHKRFSEKKLIGQRCWGALDLSKRRDFTVATFYFYVNNKKEAVHFFYIPKEQIKIKMQQDSYKIEQWVKEGYITATPGETVDYSFMFQDIIEFSKTHEIMEIAYDRNLSELIIEPLADKFTMVDFAQSITAMSEPSKDWEAAVSDSQIIDNNPVMDWMVSCASIKEDANGNIKVIKPEANKTSKRIDGVITSIMANNRLENALAEEARESDFDVDNAIY